MQLDVDKAELPPCMFGGTSQGLKSAADNAIKALQGHLSELLNDEAGDFKIVVQSEAGPQTLLVWQDLMRKRSDVFAAMLAHDFTESQEKSMSLEGFSMAEVRAFFEFIYTGTAHLQESTVMGVAALSDKYQVPTLQQFCSAWLNEHWTVESVPLIYISCLQHPGSEDRGEQCLQFIDMHAGDVLPHLHVLPDSTIDAILSREGLCILEYELIDGLLKWVEQDKKTAEIVTSILAKYARLDAITADQRAEILPRLKKAKIEEWGRQASHAPARAVIQAAVLAGLKAEYGKSGLGSKPYVGYWATLITSRATLLECQDCYNALISGTAHRGVSMQAGDSLAYFIPHRRVRPLSFTIRFGNGDFEKNAMVISASLDGSKWIELVHDTSKSSRAEGSSGSTLCISCRCTTEFKWFKVEALAKLPFHFFDIEGVVFAS